MGSSGPQARGIAAPTAPGPGRSISSRALLRCGAVRREVRHDRDHEVHVLTGRTRGTSVCGNALKVSRTLVESRLLAAIQRDLFTEELLAVFKAEVTRLWPSSAGDRNRTKPGRHAAESRRAGDRAHHDGDQGGDSHGDDEGGTGAGRSRTGATAPDRAGPARQVARQGDHRPAESDEGVQATRGRPRRGDTSARSIRPAAS